MISDSKIRDRLVALLPFNYRKIIAARVGCHPNTVYNVLHDGRENALVELEIFILAKEEKDRKDIAAKKIRKLTRKLGEP